MITTIHLRRGTAAQWTTADPILGSGEPGLETDTTKVKWGDGVTHWTALPYSAASAGEFAALAAQKGQPGGLATLDGGGFVPDRQIAGTIARDAEVSAAVAAESTARDQAISTAINALVNGAPGLLDTLGEIAAQLGVDESAAAALTTAVNARLIKALYDANSIVKADVDDTPVVLPVPSSTLIGRGASGVITALTVAQVKALLVLSSADLSDVASLATTTALSAAIASEVTARNAAIAAQHTADNGAYLPFQKQTVVVFGDSITARGGPITVTTATYYESDGYWPWAAQELRHALALLNNAGVSGNTTTQMLARIQTDVIAYAPGWCVVMGGVNDLVSASDAVASATATIANLDAIYTRLTAAGIRVVAATINPCDSATTAGKQAIVIVNQWIKRQSRSRANLLCVDFHVTVADPSTGNYAANLTTDGTHPSTAGAYKMGHALAQVIAPHVGPGDTLTASALDSRQILANPMLSGTGGTNSAGSTGTPPTSWTSSPGGGTVVVSKVARTDGSPNDWTQLVITNAGTSQGANLFQTVSGQTLWTPGDGFLYVFEAEYEIDSGYTDPSTNAQRAGLYLTLDFQNGSSSTVAKAQDTLSVQDKGAKGGPYTYGYPASPRITKGVLRTPPITPPATATKFVAWLQANFDSATVRWGRVGVRRLLTASDI